MGNTTSEVASGVKAQVNSDGQGPELYRFVNLQVKLIFDNLILLKSMYKNFREVVNSLMLCV